MLGFEGKSEFLTWGALNKNSPKRGVRMSVARLELSTNGLKVGGFV
jgi:hypothetical protein